MTFADGVLKFYKHLKITSALPRGIEILNPYQNKIAFEICKTFYGKYYHDYAKRFLIMGINPGRHGAGITGIPFTDPIKLETMFDIKNPLPKKPELSADFIHSMIAAFGGTDRFFSHFFINSISPLGFTRDGRNLNYYDDTSLKRALRPFITGAIENLIKLNIDRSVVFCLGEGENLKYLRMINEEERFFERIIPLPHPRFIMQYRRKHVTQYVEDYVAKLNSVL